MKKIILKLPNSGVAGIRKCLQNLSEEDTLSLSKPVRPRDRLNLRKKNFLFTLAFPGAGGGSGSNVGLNTWRYKFKISTHLPRN